MSGAAMDAAARTALGWAVELGLRSAAIVVAATLVASMCRPARLRARVWLTALVLAVSLPLLMWALPPARWSVPLRVADVSAAAAPASVMSRVERGVTAWVTPSATAEAPTSSAMGSWRVLVAALYLVVVGGFALRLRSGWRRASQLRTEGRRIDDPDSLARVARLAARCGLRWMPELVESPRLVVPAAIGVRSPVIALTADWREWTEEVLDAVLIHELTHIARGDTHTVAASQLFRVIAWANPAAWWLHRELTDSAEMACDESALETGVSAATYAETLLTFVRRVSTAGAQPVAYLAMARPDGHRSEARIDRVLTWQPSQETSGRRRLALATAVATVAGVAILASVRVQAGVRDQVLTSSRLATVNEEVTVRPPNPTEPAIVRALRNGPPQPRGRPPDLALEMATPNPPGFSVPLIIRPQTPAAPVVLTMVDPVYTQAALDRRLEGNVELEVVVAPDGRVGEVKVVRSLDRVTGLDDEAVRAARQWVFRTTGDSPTVNVIMEFRLTKRGGAVGTSTYVPRALADPFATGAYWSGAVGVQLPTVKRQILPKYTSDAMRRRLEGTVEIEAVVLADGTVGNVRVLRSLDPDYGLDEQALAAARQSTFNPGTLYGQAVPIVVDVKLQFRLH